MIILALAVLMASADGYRIDSGYPQPMGPNVLKTMCEQNGVNYSNVENSAVQFVNCLQLNVGVTMLESELKQAVSDDQFEKIFKKLCAKSPQIKSCWHPFWDVVIPCAGNKKYDLTQVTKNVTDQVLDYVCFNGGEPITTFVTNRGPQCFQSEQYDILMCAEYYKNAAMYTQQSMNLTAAFDLNDSLLKCITEKLERCDNPIAAIFFKNITRIVRDGFSQILESAVNDMDPISRTPPAPSLSMEYDENVTRRILVMRPRTPSPSASVSRPSSTIASSQMSDNMMKTMCEQNGINYNNIEISTIQFLNCVDSSFGVTMFERELKLARYGFQYREVFEKYCAKSPQLKRCYHTFYDAVIPCAGGEKYHATKVTKHITDQVLDYVCFNGGEPLATFVINHGHDCFSRKQHEIKMCVEYYEHKFTYIETMDLPKALKLSENLLECIADNLKTCDNPIASQFFKNVSEIVRDGFVQGFKVDNQNKIATSSEVYNSSPQPWTDIMEPTTPLPVGEPLQLMCERNGVNYQTIEVATFEFYGYIRNNFNFNVLREAQDNSSYSKIFKEYCAKSPQLKTNYRKMMDVVSPCFGINGHNYSVVSNNVNDNLLDYLCYNDGSRVTKFFAEGGLDCIQSKSFEIMQCEKDLSWLESGWSLTIDEIFAKLETFLNCIVQKINTCNRPIASKMLKAIIKIIHKTVSPGVDEPIYNVTIPDKRTKPEESLDIKFSKMCEANGENYGITTTIGDDARSCLEDHLHMTISYEALMNAKYTGFFEKFFQRYCAKKTDPELRSCIHTFTYGVSPCFGHEAQHYLASTVKAYNKILDYVCETSKNDGFERISKFFSDRGFKCLENNAHDILRCTENKNVLDCTLKKLEACDSYKLFETIGSIIRTSSLNEIKRISSYAARSTTAVSNERHIKTSGNLILSFDADIIV